MGGGWVGSKQELSHFWPTCQSQSVSVRVSDNKTSFLSVTASRLWKSAETHLKKFSPIDNELRKWVWVDRERDLLQYLVISRSKLSHQDIQHNARNISPYRLNRKSGNYFVSEYGHVGTLKRGLEKPQMMKKELTHSNHCRLRKRPKCDFGSV